MQNHTDLARRLLELVGRSFAVTALSFGAPASMRLRTASRGSRP